LVESLVASIVLGVGVLAGLTALDTVNAGARVAQHQAWATCAVRLESEAVQSLPMDDSYPNQPQNVRATVRTDSGSGTGELQVIDVVASDPLTGRDLASATVLKSAALSPPAGTTQNNYLNWCKDLLK
jgi:Tfp pilus assembly protein PilV